MTANVDGPTTSEGLQHLSLNNLALNFEDDHDPLEEAAFEGSSKDIYEHLGDDLVTTEIKVTADSGANHQRGTSSHRPWLSAKMKKREDCKQFSVKNQPL